MLRKLFVRLWKDESGAVIATEYLMLGSIVALGSATGLATMRDSVADEFGEFGNAVRDTRQAYSIPKTRGGNGSAGGSVATNTPAAAASTVAVAPVVQNPQVVFTCP